MARLFLVILEGGLAEFTFTIGRILTFPFPDVHRRWLKFTIPAQISFLEECLSSYPVSAVDYREVYEETRHAISIYKKELQRVEAND